MKIFLKEFREKLKLTQNELSLKLDIAQTTIARYESNKIKPTSTIIFKYINELNANPVFLFLGIGPIFLKNSAINIATNDKIRYIHSELTDIVESADVKSKNGNREPDFEFLEALFQKLNINPNWMFKNEKTVS